MTSWLLASANSSLSQVRKKLSACASASECRSLLDEASRVTKDLVEYLRVCVLLPMRANHVCVLRFEQLRSQTSQSIDTFLYFTTCIAYVVVVWLFLITIAMLLLQVRRESSAAATDRRSAHSTLRSTAELVHRMSLQLSTLAVLVVVCFFFRAGCAFPPK